MRKKIIAAFSIAIFVVTFAFTGISSCLAGSYDNYGLDDTITTDAKLKDALSVTAVNSSGGGGFLSSRIGQIVGTILSFVGVVFLILIIYAGLQWMTSRGNQQEVEKSKDLIIAAVIGLIIVLGAYAITAFIGTELVK